MISKAGFLRITIQASDFQDPILEDLKQFLLITVLFSHFTNLSYAQ